MPAWKRDVPLLFIGDTLLFVPLIGVNRDAFWRPAAHACPIVIAGGQTCCLPCNGIGRAMCRPCAGQGRRRRFRLVF